jgi:LacI family transcriptional regulator
MKDIAKELGLSAVTVSKVLSGHPDISDETRERVLRRVKELNYQPSSLARSLVTGRSFLVGLIVPELIHPFFAEVAKGLATTISRKGYSLIISCSEEDPELERREIRQLRARRLDALVIASTQAQIVELDREQDDEVFILIDRDLPDAHAHFIGIDDKAAGRIATEHLIDIGCRRIAHIRGRDNSTGLHRFEGYLKALADRGIEFNEALVVHRSIVDNESQEQGSQAMQLLLDSQERPDGVFCYNDPVAIGAMRTIFAAGLRIPEDIALIGCGNLHFDDFLRVGLSSVNQHSQQIGERAGELVLSLLDSKERGRPRSYILDPELVVRDSTRRLNKHTSAGSDTDRTVRNQSL